MKGEDLILSFQTGLHQIILSLLASLNPYAIITLPEIPSPEIQES